MAASKFCSICRHGYRGLYGVHASTASHRAKVARRENKGYDVGRKHAGRHSAALSRSRQERDDAAMVNVDDYYRNPPTPPWPAAIHEKVWYVVRHWRRPPGSVSGGSRVAVGHHRRRRRRKAKR